MASKVFNVGAFQLQNRTIDFIANTIKVMLIGTASPYVFNPNEATMVTPASSELTGSGYVPGFVSGDRHTLAGKAITNDTVNNRTVYNSTNTAAWTIATGPTLAAAIVYYHNVSDAASVPLFFLQFTPVPTNGAAITIDWNTGTLAYTQQ